MSEYTAHPTRRTYAFPDGRTVAVKMHPYFRSPRGSMGEEVAPTWRENANAYARAALAEGQRRYRNLMLYGTTHPEGNL